MKNGKLLALNMLVLLSGCTESKQSTQMEVLEKWQAGDAFNVALLVPDTSQFNSRTAFEAVSEYCGEKCNVAYFYGTKGAYDLHALSRSTFTNPNIDYGGDIKRMIKAQNEWKVKDNNWKKVQENLIATVSFDDFQPYPYK
jgi:hypothetical protein